MEVETTLAESIRTMDLNARYDAACKRLLSEKILLGLGSEKDENYGGILKLLDVLLSGELKAEEKKRLLKRDFDLAMATTMEQEVDHVCNLSEGVMKRGVEKGLQQGVERGRAEGRAESIRSLMESMGLTLEQAMDALKIPKEERGRYGELLKRQ